MMDAPSNIDECSIKRFRYKKLKRKRLVFCLKLILTSEKSTNFSSKLLLTKPLDVIFLTIFKNFSSVCSFEIFFVLAIDGVCAKSSLPK